LVYGARIDKDWHVVRDGSLGPAYERIASPTLSAVGGRLAYTAARHGKWHVVIDGEEGPSYDEIGEIVFSHDGRRVAYTAKGRNSWSGDWFVVVDGKKSDPLFGVALGSLMFSSDSRHVLYVEKGRYGRFERIAIDSTVGPWYDRIEGIAVSPDCLHLAYAAYPSHGGCEIIVDGQFYERCLNVDFGYPKFSPGGILYYIARDLSHREYLHLGGTTISDSEHSDYLGFDVTEDGRWELLAVDSAGYIVRMKTEG
jgi:hypothetical protein